MFFFSCRLVSVQSKKDSKEKKVRRFADFVDLSVSVLDEAEEGTGGGEWKGEDDEEAKSTQKYLKNASNDFCVFQT